MAEPSLSPPRRFAEPPSARHLDQFGSPAQPASGTGQTRLASGEVAETERPQSSSFAQTPGNPLRDEADSQLRQADLTDVMRELRAADSQSAGQARRELIRRGFSEVDLDVARRLLDPDPEARKVLARTLPGLQSVEATPWLLLLSRDEDAEVRLTAITLLATCADPAVLTQVEEMSRRDADPRVREQAERIGRQRELTGRRASEPERTRRTP